MKTILPCCVALVLALAFNLHAAPPKKSKKSDNVDAATLIKRFDTDGDHKLDKAELSKALRSLKTNKITTKNDSWKRFDTNGDGKLDVNELKKLLEEDK